MRKRETRFTRHLPHYLPLVGIFTSGIIAFLLFSYDTDFQRGVIIAVALAHIAWGVIHHYIHRDLNLEIVVEYITIALLGVALLFSIVGRM